MAMWMVSYDCDGVRSTILIHAADAKSMKRADLNASVRNAADRAKARLVKRGLKNVKIYDARCVG